MLSYRCNQKGYNYDHGILESYRRGGKKMTQIEKALELIETFASGDADKAYDLLAEGYIQHNLAYGTGRDAFIGSVKYLARHLLRQQ